MYLVLVSITALILILKLYNYVDKFNLEEKNIFFPNISKYLLYLKYSDMFILCNNFYAKVKLMYLFYYFNLNITLIVSCTAFHWLQCTQNSFKTYHILQYIFFSALAVLHCDIFYEGKIYTLGIYIIH